jgi:hypothetical protein
MKKARRAPFVVTMAIAAVGSACGGSTDSDGSGGGGSGGSPGGGGYGANPPSIPCPTDLPAEGDACPVGGWWGNSCTFVDPCGGPQPFYAECNMQTGQWHLLGSTDCSACPTSAPMEGTGCAVAPGAWCSYPGDGCCPDEFQCISGKWEKPGVSCNPPPVVCPEEPPAHGTPCEPCGYGTCDYICNEKASSSQAVCVQGTWQVTQLPCVGADAGAGSGSE